MQQKQPRTKPVSSCGGTRALRGGDLQHFSASHYLLCASKYSLDHKYRTNEYHEHVIAYNCKGWVPKPKGIEESANFLKWPFSIPNISSIFSALCAHPWRYKF